MAKGSTWFSRAARLCVAILTFTLLGSAFGGGPRAYRKDRLLIVPRAGAEAQLHALHARKGHKVRRHFDQLGGIEVLQLGAGDEPLAKAREYIASGLVESAEPDYILHASAVPNDPGFSNSWDLNNTGQNGGTAHGDIDAVDAWDTQNSAANVIVAVIDSGVRYTHEDLAANMWTNPGEVAGNGRDDDGNGVIDDVHGYNAIDNSGDPYDDCGHGTHVAGTIGAAANNGKGIAGVCWKVQIMALKFMDSTGQGNTSDAITCINYARQHGAKVINASWGGPNSSSALRTAINSARNAGIVFVVAAGNDQANNDVTPSYPANYSLDNIISVAATNNKDQFESLYSNYGAATVDIAAPGTAIYSTWNASDSAYQTMSGTSMAAPHVTGAVALLRATYPSDSYQSIIARLYAGVDKLPSLAGKCVTGGRLNIGKLFPHHWTLNASYSGQGSLAVSDPEPSYLNGSSVQLLATPAGGYVFAGWSGDLTGTNNPVSVTFNANKTIVASFVPASTAANAPVITRVQRSADGKLTLNFPTNLSFHLETSTNLKDWSAVDSSSVQTVSGGVQIAGGTESCRFYRVILN